MVSPASIDAISFFYQAKRVRNQIVWKFSKSHQILTTKETALLTELDHVVASYNGEEIKKQIQQFRASKEFMIATIRQNESTQTLQLSIAPLNARMNELQNKLDTIKVRMKSVQLEWDEELEQRLSQIGKITINAEKKIGITSPRPIDWSANSSKQPKSKQALQGALNFPSKPPCLPDTTRFTDSCPSQIIQEGMNAEVPCVQDRDELGLSTREILKNLRSEQEWKSPSKRNISIKVESGLGESRKFEKSNFSRKTVPGTGYKQKCYDKPTLHNDVVHRQRDKFNLGQKTQLASPSFDQDAAGVNTNKSIKKSSSGIIQPLQQRKSDTTLPLSIPILFDSGDSSRGEGEENTDMDM